MDTKQWLIQLLRLSTDRIEILEPSYFRHKDISTYRSHADKRDSELYIINKRFKDSSVKELKRRGYYYEGIHRC